MATNRFVDQVAKLPVLNKDQELVALICSLTEGTVAEVPFLLAVATVGRCGQQWESL